GYVGNGNLSVRAPTLTQSLPLVVAGHNGGSERFKGYIAEIILFAKDVSGDEREKIELYLHEKYLGQFGSTMAPMAAQSKAIKTQFTCDNGSLAVPLSYTYNTTTYNAGSSYFKTFSTRGVKFLDAYRTQWDLKWTGSPINTYCTVIEYKDYPAIEWVPSFENSTGSTTPYTLTNVLSLNTTLTSSLSASQPSLSQWDANSGWTWSSGATQDANAMWTYYHGWVGDWKLFTDTSTSNMWKCPSYTYPYIKKNSGNLYAYPSAPPYVGGSGGHGSSPAICWTAPATGFYTLQLDMQKTTSGGDGVEWSVWDQFNDFIGLGTLTNTTAVSKTISKIYVCEKERIYITLNCMGTNTADETKINCTFTQVTPPASLNLTDYKLHFMRGSNETALDFEPVDWQLYKGFDVNIAPHGGRPSDDHAVPFFNVEKPDKTGIIYGIGWTGQWKTWLTRGNNDCNLTLKTGMEDCAFKLNAAEKVRMPSTLVSYWDGDCNSGIREFRYLLRDHYSPVCPTDNTPKTPPVPMSLCGSSGFETLDKTRANYIIDQCAANNFDADCIHIDTGWFHCISDNWAISVGNWAVDTERYYEAGKDPGTVFAEVTSHARDDHGYGWDMWFEPERVMPNTEMYGWHHPDPNWLLHSDSAYTPNGLLGYIPANQDWHLMNYCNSTVVQDIYNRVHQAINDFHITEYRQDFNIRPLSFWRTRDASSSQRKGISEIQYVSGLYKLLDDLLAAHPDLAIDNCASGGRRIDFEMLKRCFVQTRTDYLWHEESDQSMTLGLAPWLPYQGGGAVVNDPYYVDSGMGSLFIFAFNVDGLNWTTANNMTSDYYTVCNAMLKGDYYPLTSYSQSNSVWLAWQYNNPQQGEAVVQAFRRPSATSTSQTYKLRGLEPGATYTVNDVHGRSVMYASKTGLELMNTGLTITLNTAKTSKLIRIVKQ
ncbi:MAG: alpha-galactosidase, partial [Sedimentisphaerales bacterium]|nr:alpha-galactosidase [Sedimentisphaerales bacterium]